MAEISPASVRKGSTKNLGTKVSMKEKVDKEVITALPVPTVIAPGQASAIVFNVTKRGYEPEAPQDNFAAGARLEEYAPRIIQFDAETQTVRVMRKNTGMVIWMLSLAS